MRILVVITGLGVGGAERLVTGLADHFTALGHEVLLVFFHGELELSPSHSSVRVETLSMERTPSGVVSALWRFRKLITEFQPDVVNSHLVHANILTRLLRLVAPMPRLVSSAHNTNEQGRGRMLAYRLTDRLADISTNVSNEAVEAFEHQGALRPGRMVAIHNSIDIAVFTFNLAARERVRSELNLDKAVPLLLAVGRLRESKDYPNLLRAFASLEGSPVQPQLAIVGDGPLRGELEVMAKSLGVADRVHFLGVRHDVPALMAASDVFVLSSAWEGFGLVAAEAMACERPVVATDCGGVREVVADAGFLVPPRNSPALTEAMRRALCLSDGERERLGVAARARVVANFSLDAMANRYLAIYEGRCQQANLQGHD